jgi:hypothetical protein
MSTTISCEFCEKKGLPVLLTRYAVAAPNSQAPTLKAPLNLEGVPSLGRAKYTVRLLRKGFVYVFDEARHRWEEYETTPDGYFFKLPPRLPNAPKLKAPEQFACSRSEHAPIAQVITITDPKNATVVWVGFSEVQWTDEIFTRHAKPEYRARHMQKIMLSGGRVTPKQPHLAPISQVDALVAEYRMDPSAAVKEFAAWVPFAFNSRARQAQDFKKAMVAQAQDTGVILALHDPSGIAQEVAALMHHLSVEFMSHPQRYRQIGVNQAIKTLRFAVEELAEAEHIKGGQFTTGYLAGMSSGISLIMYGDKFKATPKSVKQARNTQWEKYQTRYGEKARSDWEQNVYVPAFQQHNDLDIVPLDKAHAQWMQSQAMLAYFVCNFDPSHLPSGIAYAQIISLCVAHTTDKVECSRLYEQWLAQGNAHAHENLLLRALMTNYTPLIDKVQEASHGSVNLVNAPWDNLVNMYKGAVEKITELSGSTWQDKLKRADGLSRLIEQMLGPIAKVASQGINAVGQVSQQARLLLLLVGVQTGVPLVPVRVSGTVGQVHSKLVAQLLMNSDAKLSPRQIRTAVELELERLRVYDPQALHLPVNTVEFLVIDKDVVKGVPVQGSLSEKVLQTVSAIKTVEQARKAMSVSVKNILTRDARLGVAVALAQSVATYSAVKDVDTAMSHQKAWYQDKLVGVGLGLVGTLAETAGQMLDRTTWGKTPLGGKLNWTRASVLKFSGRVLGAAGGALIAFLDAKEGWCYLQERNTGLAFAYFLSAGLGAAATVLALAGSVVLGGVLFLAAIFIAIFIEMSKDNKLEMWLERCVWGRKTTERYPTAEEELKQLQVATA